MSAIRTLALHAWREQLRSRSLLTALFFSGLLLYMSLLFGVLAVDQELRVLLDFGLGFIELLCLLLCLHGAASSILREMETKTIYLVLSRPVPRWSYLLGRTLGLLLTCATAAAAMAAVHLSLLLLKGWSWQNGYLLALAGIGLKLCVAACLATFLSLLSTSALSAMSLSGILWLLGHFVPELGFLARRASRGLSTAPLFALTYLVPNLQLLNLRDRLDAPASAGPEPLLAAAGYALLYCAACLALSHSLLRRKEF